MESVSLEHGGRGFRGDGAELGLWTPAPNVLLIRIVGHGLTAFANCITQEFDALTRGGNRVHLFTDLGRMESYDSMLRIRCTEHFRVNLKSFESLQVLVKSRLVTMAVAVANVALNGIITMHTSSSDFRRALDNQLVMAGVRDFSSDVLAS